MNILDFELLENVPDSNSKKGCWVTPCGSLSFPSLPVDTGTRRKVRVGIRPEHLEILAKRKQMSGHEIQARVQLDELLGADALLVLAVGDARLTARVSGIDHPKPGDHVTLNLPLAQLHVFDAETGMAI